MRHISLTGTIYDEVITRTFTNKEGQPDLVATIRFHIRDREWNRETRRAEWQTVLFCEAGAFGKTAEIWANKFKKGDVVEVSGIPSIRTFESNGQTRTVLIVGGPRGSAAEIEHTPRLFAPREEQPTVNDEELSQEPPF